MILGVQFDPITFIKTRDYTKTIKISNTKLNSELVNRILQEVKTNDFLKRLLIIRSATLLIYFLFNLLIRKVWHKTGATWLLHSL